jgi:hypothetical protein
MKLKGLFAVLIVVFLVNNVEACRMFGMPISKANPDEYIFVGTVTGYGDVKLADGVDRDLFRETTALSLIVKATEFVNAPLMNEEMFEVVRIGYGPDCRFFGPTHEDLDKYFPIGSQVRVIARKAVYFDTKIVSKRIGVRLETGPTRQSGVWPNVNGEGSFLTSATSIFDYSKAVHTLNGDWGAAELPTFEFRKDLWRLEKAKSQSDRNRILDRLVLFPQNDPTLILIEQLLKNYTSSESEYRHYMDTRKNILKSLPGQ